MERSEQFRKDVEYYIDGIGEDLDLPTHLLQHSKETYGKYHTEERAFSRPAQVFAVASLYMSAKILEYPVKTLDLTRDNDVDEKHAIRAYKDIQKHLAKTEDINPLGAPPDKFIQRYGNELNASEELIEKAKEVRSQTEEIMQNRASSTQAAASLYTASILLGSRDFTQEQLSEISGASEATIRSRCREQKEVVLPKQE